MELPKIREKEIVLLRVQRSTGIILNNDNSFYLNEGHDYYRIFNSIDEAKMHIYSLFEDHIDYLLYDSEYNLLEQMSKV